MLHRKRLHIKYVKECRDSSYCGRGESCCFKNTENIPESVSDNHDKGVMKRLFDIMKKYGERIDNIEKVL